MSNETNALALHYHTDPQNMVTKVENCGRCVRHMHAMMASGLNKERAYQLAAINHDRTHGLREQATMDGGIQMPPGERGLPRGRKPLPANDSKVFVNPALKEGGGGGLGGGTVPNSSIGKPFKKFRVAKNPPLVREDSISKPKSGGRTVTGSKANKINSKPTRLLKQRMKQYQQGGL